MEDRIDPLIVERAPWLANASLTARLARPALDRVLGYDEVLALARQFEGEQTSAIMAQMADRLCKMVEIGGLGNIPRFGPALVVANHPTGLADGIILHSLLARVRNDTYIFANSDILRILPQMRSIIAPVEWRIEKRSHAKTRETMAYVSEATAAGRLGVIFPSGRLAQRRGLRLHERPWMASAAMLARKFDLPVIPVNIQARNSLLYYISDAIHPTLRDITLFHETLNKDRQPFRVTVGEPISPSALPSDAKKGIALLREATLALGGRDAPTVNMVRSSRIWA